MLGWNGTMFYCRFIHLFHQIEVELDQIYNRFNKQIRHNKYIKVTNICVSDIDVFHNSNSVCLSLTKTLNFQCPIY